MGTISVESPVVHCVSFKEANSDGELIGPHSVRNCMPDRLPLPDMRNVLGPRSESFRVEPRQIGRRSAATT